MITFALINHAGLSDKEMSRLFFKTQFFLDGFCYESKIEHVNVGAAPSDQTWNVYITNQGQIRGAGAYHKTFNKNPVAFCLPFTRYSRFGNYHKGLTFRGKVFWKDSFRAGLLTDICHEACEMLMDPQDDTLTPPDKLGRQWHKEVADHVFGQYFVDSEGCVYPDYALPAFYDVNGVAPFNRNKTIKHPFTLSPQGYGYYLLNDVLEKLR